MCNCLESQSFKINRRYDPTKTTTLRLKFVQDVNRRFSQLKRAVVAEVVKEDVFGLKEKSLRLKTNKKYAFKTNPEKVQGFMSWLRKQADEGVLEIHYDAGAGYSSSAWQNIYIQSAYKKGMKKAYQNLEMLGKGRSPVDISSSFLGPDHAESIGMLYTRVFEDLKGITNEMSKQMSHVLSQGLIDGLSPVVIAKNLSDRVDKIGRTRARMLARTEVIRAHHVATITSYEAAGVLDIKVQAEFLSANDNKVCPECASLDGKVYSLENARDLIPVHPNCRCTTVPYLPKHQSKSISSPSTYSPADAIKIEESATIRKDALGNLTDFNNLQKIVRSFAKEQKFAGRPTLKTAADFFSTGPKGRPVIYRGLGGESKEVRAARKKAFKFGKAEYPFHHRGSGMYFSSGESAGEIAEIFSGKDTSAVLTGRLKKRTKIISSTRLSGKLSKWVAEQRSRIAKGLESAKVALDTGKITRAKYLSDISTFDKESAIVEIAHTDLGLFAIISGYDAIAYEKNAAVIVLNRTALDILH